MGVIYSIDHKTGIAMQNENNLISAIDSIAKSTRTQNQDHRQEVLEQLPLKRYVEENREQLKSIAKHMGCTKEEALFFAVMFYQQLKGQPSGVDITDMAEHFGVGSMEILNQHSFFREMKQNKLIKQNQNIKRHKIAAKKQVSMFDGPLYITREAYEAVISGQCLAEICQTGEMEMFELLEHLEQIISDHDDGGIGETDMQEQIAEMVNANRELPFIKRVNKLKLSTNEKLLLFHICYELIDGEQSVDLVRACNKIFGSLSQQFKVRRSFLNGRARLIKKNIVQLEEADFRNDKTLRVTEEGLDYLFEDEEDVLRLQYSQKQESELTTPDNLQEQQLFFNQRERQQLQFIESLLDEEQYQQVVSRLSENNMPSGLTILFYGEPGTGKTESVYQMARKTGRSIMPVEISSIRTKWYGESQKLLKKVFENYRKKKASHQLAPILLFNEADAIFHARMEEAHEATNQTENALQNILLQELEDMEGILIATTNLSTRLDKAFERRFLYKLHFDKPGAPVKQSIWRAKIPKLTKRQAQQLASSYDLSGGQINNVARKYLMQEVLQGNQPNLNELKQYCEEEHLTNAKTNTIGFGVRRAG